MGLGQTWGGSRGRNPVPDLERGLETATTAAGDFSHGLKDNAPKEVSTASEVSKVRLTSDFNPQCEFLVPRDHIVTLYEFVDAIKFLALSVQLLRPA